MAGGPGKLAAGRTGRGVLSRPMHEADTPDALEPRWREPGCRVIPVCEQRIFLNWADTDNGPRLLAPRRREAAEMLSHADSPSWVGELGGEPCFAVRLHRFQPRQRIPGGDFAELRSVAGQLSDAEWSLLARAKSLIHWHDSHGFCPRCGSETRRQAAGLSRRCVNPGCGAPHFPRTDPAVIVRVTRGEHILLARQPDWPKARRSVLAGFVSPGETAESAVRREVFEEAGLRIDPASLCYVQSQPWPFPGSLMLAYIAQTADCEIRCLDGEVTDAQWWTRADIRKAVANEDIQLPSTRSIAATLIRDWLDQG